MLAYIYGGTSSGKSLFGEEYVHRLHSETKDYLATMKLVDQESRQKVQKHQNQRKGKNFRTIEIFEGEKIFSSKSSVAFLECLSNLVANFLYQDGKVLSLKEAKGDLTLFFEELIQHYEDIVIIGNDIFKEEELEGLEIYMELMRYFHNYISGQSDEVIRVIAGIPIYIKES